MNSGRRIAGNTLVQVAGKLVVALVAVVTLSLVLKGYGEAAQGKYILAITYGQFVATLADFGLATYFVRVFSLGSRHPRHVSQALPLRLVSAVVIFSLGALLVFVFPYDLELRQAIWLSLLATFFISLNSLLVAFYQSRLKMQVPVGAEVTNRVVVLAGTAAAVMAGVPFLWVLGAVSAGAFVNLVVTAGLLRGQFPIARRPDLGTWRAILAESLPIWVTAILILIYFRVDTLFLSFLPLPAGRESLVELANYGTAYKFLEILIAIPGMFLGVVLPFFARAERDPARLSEIFRHAFYAVSVFAAPVAVGTFLVAEPLMAAFFPELSEAAAALKILIWAFGFSALASTFIYLVLGLGEQRRLIRPYLVVTIANVVLNLLLIPLLGFRGAAYSTILSELLLVLTGWWVTRQLGVLKDPISPLTYRAWVAAFLMGGIVFLVPEVLALQVVVGLVAYPLILWALGGIDRVALARVVHHG